MSSRGALYHVIDLKQTRGIKNVTLKAAKKKKSLVSRSTGKSNNIIYIMFNGVYSANTIEGNPLDCIRLTDSLIDWIPFGSTCSNEFDRFRKARSSIWFNCRTQFNSIHSTHRLSSLGVRFRLTK